MSDVLTTVFNCTNMLIGAGILALPFGLRQCGWVVGLTLLTLPAVVTAFTADLLVECIRMSNRAITYGDIAYAAFGSIRGTSASVLLILELVGANVALIVLFADSASKLLPSISTLAWKVIVALGLLPLNFMPLRTFSVSSLIGIFCFLGILATLVTIGCSTPLGAGSLLEVGPQQALPSSTMSVLSSFGIFIAPWGGHSIVPVAYSDMKDSRQYPQALKWTYLLTYTIALSTGVAGYLMFGRHVCPEVAGCVLTPCCAHCYRGPCSIGAS